MSMNCSISAGPRLHSTTPSQVDWCGRRAGTDHLREVDHPPADALPERALPRPESSPRRSHRLPRARRRAHQLALPNCDAVVYGPPLNTHCTTLEGPATVRISNVT